MGFYIGMGLLSAGGGNSLFNLVYNDKLWLKNVIGLYMFNYYWYWYPLVNFIGLSIDP